MSFWKKLLGVEELTLNLGDKVTMRLVRIPAGKCMLGSSDPEDNNGQHEVTIGKPFYIGATQVTVDQYAAFVKDTGHRHEAVCFEQTGDHPVVRVTCNDAKAFCEWSSRKTGKTVVLPTEAEWEYACRAGATTRFCFGNDDKELGRYAWYVENSGRTTHPVGLKKPNAWGLYDVHGNALEWCSNCVERGGHHSNAPWCCGSAARSGSHSGMFDADYEDFTRGFRVAAHPGAS
jgi:formylglycine-generating enzyme required for sulfatase activity